MPSYQCTKCLQEKDETNFPHGKGRRHSWCRSCCNIAKKSYRERYREAHPRKRRLASERETLDGLITCSKCQEARPRPSFAKKIGWCRLCRATAATEARRAKGLSPRIYSRVEDEKKSCTKCLVPKALTEFSPTIRGVGGVAAHCKECVNNRPKDRDRTRKATAAYRNRHSERHKAAHRIRMYEYRGNKHVTSDGSVTDEVLISLYAQDTCHYCFSRVPMDIRTIDHKTALSRGGHHTSTNLVMACRSCNSAKRSSSEDEFKNRMNK